MATPPRFKESGFNRRTFGCHRYDVYSPKMQRQLILFGRHALDLWTTLEASPTVLSFCERPITIPDRRPARAVDFWVRRAEGEEFLILLRETELPHPENSDAMGFTKIDGIPVRCIDPNEMSEHRITLINLGWIIRDLSAFGRFVPEPLCRALANVLTQGKSIAQLQQELNDFDSSTVKLAVYTLLHRGEAVCRELTSKTLGLDLVIEAP